MVDGERQGVPLSTASLKHILFLYFVLAMSLVFFVCHDIVRVGNARKLKILYIFLNKIVFNNMSASCYL